jgi:hypothetical protein
MATYITVDYDGQSGGEFVEEGANVTWVSPSAGVGFIVTDIPDGTAGTLKMALVSGPLPDDNAVLTQGGVTANANAVAPAKIDTMLYPAYFREDVAVAASGAITWTGPALGATHSFFFDGQTVNVVANEILTFSGGQTCEVITVESDAGATGELSVRFIGDIDIEGLPADNETFTGDIAGDGTVNGVVHPRGYTPEELHRLLMDLNDDENIFGDDDLSMVDATASDRQTGVQVKLLGNININDAVSQHMYGGSIEQGSGTTQEVYSGLGVNVTSPLASSQPVLISEDGIITDYWVNAYFPNSVAGKVRILVKTIEAGVKIDGQRVRGALLEFGELYFFAGTTIGFGEVSLALVSSPDGNNNTAVGTVATYSPTYVEGYQLLDFLEGSGSTPFGLSVDFDTNTSLETYEHTKYVQRRGTAETLFGRNAQLFTGINVNFDYDAETGTIAEDNILIYGTEVPFTGGTGTVVAVGDTVQDTTTLARGRVLFVDETTGAGTIIVADPTGSFGNTNGLTTLRGASEWTATSGTVVNNAASGQILLVALDDNGTTGTIWGQQLTGVVPADDQTLFGATDGDSVDVNGVVSTRTVNSQFVGSYTGSNYNPANFGIAIHPSDAIAGDQFTNLLEASIAPPDNRSGEVTNLISLDYVTVYPWDGTSTDVNGDAEPDFNEMTLSVALTAGVSTTVQTGGATPANTPAAGFLRVERDSDGNLDLLEYTSVNTSTGVFTLGGSTPTAPNNAAISNTVMRAFIDKVATATTESYTATYTTPNNVAITVRRGGSTAPIKTFKTTSSFGAFSVSTIRTPDL